MSRLGHHAHPAWCCLVLEVNPELPCSCSTEVALATVAVSVPAPSPHPVASSSAHPKLCDLTLDPAHTHRAIALQPSLSQPYFSLLLPV
jgi:hypothetical protein